MNWQLINEDSYACPFNQSNFPIDQQSQIWDISRDNDDYVIEDFQDQVFYTEKPENPDHTSKSQISNADMQEDQNNNQKQDISTQSNLKQDRKKKISKLKPKQKKKDLEEREGVLSNGIVDFPRPIESREAKNIPKVIGGYLRNFISKQKFLKYFKIAQEFEEAFQQSPTIKYFITKNEGTTQPYNYNLHDIQQLFLDPIGNQICRKFFNEHYWLQRVLSSDRIQSINLYFKYWRKFAVGVMQPENFTNLRYQ